MGKILEETEPIPKDMFQKCNIKNQSGG